jgi:hypothetical protein
MTDRYTAWLATGITEDVDARCAWQRLEGPDLPQGAATW